LRSDDERGLYRSFERSLKISTEVSFVEHQGVRGGVHEGKCTAV
jgi:hypothetical protein